MDVSIIIVNLNGQEFLTSCLASIYQHIHEVSFEVIVVDNHSSDGSIEMLKTQFATALSISSPYCLYSFRLNPPAFFSI